MQASRTERYKCCWCKTACRGTPWLPSGMACGGPHSQQVVGLNLTEISWARRGFFWSAPSHPPPFFFFVIVFCLFWVDFVLSFLFWVVPDQRAPARKKVMQLAPTPQQAVDIAPLSSGRWAILSFPVLLLPAGPLSSPYFRGQGRGRDRAKGEENIQRARQDKGGR
jgi:hypothetical protein